MIDHILCFPSPDSIPADRGPCWLDEAGRTVMPAEVIVVDATHDEAGELVSPAILAPGFWLVIRSHQREPDIEAREECLLVSDSDRAARGEPFVILARFNPDTPLGRVSPVFAGDAYPFPSGPASALEPLMVRD